MVHFRAEAHDEGLRALVCQAADLDAQGWAVVHLAPQRALDLLLRALTLAKTSGDNRILSTVLRHLAYTQYSLGNFEAAHDDAVAAVAAARQVGEPFFIGAAINMLGIALRYRGELALALEAQREHLRIAEELGHPEMRAHALNNIGSVHHDLGEYGRALEYHQAATELARELGDEVISVKALNNLASDQHRLGRTEDASGTLIRVLALARHLNIRGEEALALNSLADVALNRDSFEEAQQFAASALVTAQEVGDLGMLAGAHLHSGLAALGLGHGEQAEQHLKTALDLAVSAHIHGTQAAALNALARTHEQHGDHPEALRYLRQAHLLDLRIHAETATRRTQALSARIEAEHYRREVDRERARSAELAVVISELQAARAKQEELTAELAHQASHDALTGLAGRTLLRDRLEQAMANAAALGAPMAVLFIDLNGFKLVNDTHGHAIGDRLLQEVGQRLTGVVFGRDSVARLGGDEFVILATHLHPSGRARDVAQKVMESFEHPFWLGEVTVSVGAAIGVSVFPDDGIDADTLLKHADNAMYVAKQSGQSMVQVYQAVRS